MTTLRVAACQIDPQLGEVERNLERIDRAVTDAVQAGAALAVLPEAAVTGYAFASLDEALPVALVVGVEFHPGLFAPARAAENHCYLLAADRVGTERGTTFIGRSMLVDYDGKVLAQASDSDEELVTGEIDPEAARVTHVRRRPGEHEWDTIADRRPGLYERLLQPGVDREHPPNANLFSGDVD